MSVEFDEPVSATSVRQGKGPSFLSRLVIKAGLAKTEAGAQTLLLILAILILAVSIFFFKQGSTQPPAPSPAQYGL